MFNFPQKQNRKAKKSTAMVKIAFSLISLTVLAALMLSLVPMQPTAIVNAQRDFKLQEAKAEKLQASNAMNFKGETMTPSMVMKANPKQSGVSVARAQNGAKTFAVLNVEFKDVVSRTAFKLTGATKFAEVDRFADIFVDNDAAYEAILKNPNVVAAEFASIVDAPPPPPTMKKPRDEDSKAIPDTIVRGGFNGLTGKGVIIAVIDTGIDFRHPEFYTTDANGRKISRIKAMWDTTLEYKNGRGTKSPISYPNGASVGTVFTREQLTAELNATTKTIPPTDLDGHGTACASVAAGNGKGYTGNDVNLKNLIPGVAPEADIIAVRIDQGDSEDGLENAWTLNAANEWLDKIAGAQPLVLSCSFGGHRGAHDGSRVAERQLDAYYPLNKPKRAIVFAAGNDGDRPMHAGGAFGNKSNARLMAWNVRSNAELRVYFNTADTDLWIAPATAETKYEKPIWSQNPITKHWSATIKIPAGLGGIYVFNESGKQMEVDGYIFGGAFLPMSATATRIVASPGTATNVITVGSYDWNDNFNQNGQALLLFSVCEDKPMDIKKISCYSSRGPRRDGVVKPEIVAPGQWFIAADAKDNAGRTVGWGVGMTDTTGVYRQMNGTSSATPYTAGIIALMFQKKPNMTFGEIRNALISNADKGVLPLETLPGKSWGYGKLSEDAVKRIFAAL